VSGTREAAVAAADWGTTRLRIWLLDRQGEVLAERRSDDGLLAAQPDRFEEILERHLGEMGASADLPVVICGMAGARQGWVEAPYASVPASLADIFGAAVRVPSAKREVRIVPGLAQRDADRPDVMRGEETQLAGAVAKIGSGRHIVCMPGTHSKWVDIVDGTVASFQTFMTGELFSVLSGHSILAHSLTKDARVTAEDPHFANNVRKALASAAPLETGLFRFRAASLLQGLVPHDAAAALSGLLVGSEIAAAKALFALGDSPVVLIASGTMCDLYQASLGWAGLDYTLIDADEAVRLGLINAARELGMIKEVTG
jgi:2-dehydro-3-deoxygalactonokinase